MHQVKCSGVYAKRAVSFLPKRKMRNTRAGLQTKSVLDGHGKGQAFFARQARLLVQARTGLSSVFGLLAWQGSRSVGSLAWGPQTATGDLNVPMLDDLGR